MKTIIYTPLIKKAKCKNKVKCAGGYLLPFGIICPMPCPKCNPIKFKMFWGIKE